MLASKRFAMKESRGTIKCNNATFGDPIYGTYKQCFCKQAPETEHDEKEQIKPKPKPGTNPDGTKPGTNPDGTKPGTNPNNANNTDGKDKPNSGG